MNDFSWLYKADSKEGDFICLLCPHRCRLKPGATGFCRSRKAVAQGIVPVHENPVTALALDPIEKKPLYHFLPGQSILSVGFSGCNLRCPFCQNWQLAHQDEHNFYKLQAEDFPGLCSEYGSPGVAFTYSEPLIQFEYLINSADALHEKNLLSVVVTNGYITPPAGKVLSKHMDAVKVDLKGFNKEWYSGELKGGLQPVLDFIAVCAEQTHLEVVTLVIPGKNDNPSEIRKSAEYLASLNPDIPYHLTAYYPNYQYDIPPTSETTILTLAKIARESLKYVYTGNLGREEHTECPGCGRTVIGRGGGHPAVKAIEKGCCSHCGYPIYGRF